MAILVSEPSESQKHEKRLWKTYFSNEQPCIRPFTDANFGIFIEIWPIQQIFGLKIIKIY